MTNQYNNVTLAGETNGLGMHLCHQRTCGVDGDQPSLGGLSANFGRNTVGRIEEMGAMGNLG